MLLKDRVSVFRLRPLAEDSYGKEVQRMDISSVMVFEKRSVGVESRDVGKCVVYAFPGRSKVSGGQLTEIQPGDLVAVGACRGNFDPLTDSRGLCRRIVSVENRFCGSDRVHHVVIEAI